ncbi:pyridoxal phosphate-dependent transferase [Fusarium flagelliforme]|uniref:Aminotransferase class I/classII large domain-containing protein n=1 Tax=Fusarium flagelliforme TaxID=2675880 RepID=A0A395MIA7_9HYPO|nr:pyridoxal phosphate-dependent transferase [Fusarium flagelliforme]KAH7188553.1 pyridoxal phosphate-dependent transferase [Fusarium flagelliforme]RFN47586.1 hypothetical protein FIE12Z_8176 [Fusarium flagelliforme]
MASSRSDSTASSISATKGAARKTLPQPKDLSHLFSVVARNRELSEIKAFYKFMQIPGISNFAGGMPNVKYFPFDTLEAQIAKPDRWQPSANYPDQIKPPTLEPVLSSSSSISGFINNQIQKAGKNIHKDSDHSKTSSSRITIPKVVQETDPTKRVDLASALQYGQVTGYQPLLSFIKQFTNQILYPDIPYKGGVDVILSSGSTDGFSRVLQLLVDPWYEGLHPPTERQGMLCETFVFGNVITQAKPLGINIVPIETDEEGMVAEGPGGLREVLENWDPQNGLLPHFLYTVTMGNNPTSGVMEIGRRREIYAIASKFDIIIVEDDPYWFLQFPSAAAHEAKARGYGDFQEIKVRKPVKRSGYEFIDSLTRSYLSMDVDGRVIRLDTFSKTIAPGTRLGYITAQPAIIERLTRIAETGSGQPCGFAQALVAQVILGPHSSTLQKFFSLPSSKKSSFTGWKVNGWVRWLEGLRGEYERRMIRMCKVLEENAFQLSSSTPSSPDSEWNIITKTRLIDFDWPRGGMFLWLRIHFEKHPLYQTQGGKLAPTIDGPALSKAFLIHSTKAPHLVVGSPGSMFGATPQIRDERGWRYVRMCFAAESDENIDAGSLRFTRAVQTFFEIREAARIEELIDELYS